MFRKIVLIAGVVLLLIMLAGFFLPAEFSAKRSAKIEAPEEVVFDSLRRITTWPKWHPWLEGAEDDDLISFGDTLKGKGAVVYKSREQSDMSKVRILDVAPVRKEMEVRVQVAGQVTLTSTIHLQRKNNGTMIEWQDRGEVGINPIQRYIALAMPALLGKTIDQGLTNLKALMEKGAGKENA